MVTLDESVLDVVEANPAEWAVRVDGRWGRRGLYAGTTPRWYFQRAALSGSWYYITEMLESENYRTGTSRWDLEPSEFLGADEETHTTGELVHVSCVPFDVQLWIAGYHPDLAELGRLREEGGKQEDLAGWA